MSLLNVLLLLMILAFFGVIPTWGHSHSWGYGPSGFLVVLIIAIVVFSSRGRRRL